MEYEKLSAQRLGEPSAAIQKRVEAACQIQRDRFGVGVKHSPKGAEDPAKTEEANASPVTSTIYCNADMRLTTVANR